MVVQEPCLQAGLVGDSLHPAELFDPFVAQRQSQRPDLSPAGTGSVAGFQLRERLDRPHRQPSAVERIADLSDQSGCLRGRCCGERGFFFDQQDVVVPGGGQAVGHAASDGSATDDDDCGSLLLCHGRELICSRYQLTRASTLYSLYVENGPGVYWLELTPRWTLSQIAQSCSDVSCQKGMSSSSW